MDFQKSSRVDPDALHLETLRLSPTADAWRIEIEKILHGARDIVIEHRGDAGGYVEDLIRQAQDAAACRVSFQDALERQVEQWKPSRGVNSILELLRRFTPRSGFPRLVELFRSQNSFPGDPPLEETQFHGRDLRLAGLHALERYVPVAPLPGGEQSGQGTSDQEAFETYLSILRQHLHFPRYLHYATRLLNRIVPNSALRIILEEVEGGSAGNHPIPGQHAGGALEILYLIYLRDGMAAEERFRRQIQQQFGYKMVYTSGGPILKFKSSGVHLSLGPLDKDLYALYFAIYLKQNEDFPAEMVETHGELVYQP